MFSAACKDFDLTISTENTELMYQPAAAVLYSEPTVTVDSDILDVEDKFTYLDST